MPLDPVLVAERCAWLAKARKDLDIAGYELGAEPPPTWGHDLGEGLGGRNPNDRPPGQQVSKIIHAESEEAQFKT